MNYFVDFDGDLLFEQPLDEEVIEEDNINIRDIGVPHKGEYGKAIRYSRHDGSKILGMQIEEKEYYENR